jgi:hypothetical protein
MSKGCWQNLLWPMNFQLNLHKYLNIQYMTLAKHFFFALVVTSHINTYCKQGNDEHRMMQSNDKTSMTSYIVISVILASNITLLVV